MTLQAITAVPTVAELIRRATRDSIDDLLAAKGRPAFKHLKGLCTDVSQAYRNRVVLELLQNAHDAHSPEERHGRIRLWLDEKAKPYGVLYAANDGDGFSARNFDALCSPTETSKTVNEAIGNKGVGFLSVFQVCNYPEVRSRFPGSDSGKLDGYCFAFADEARLRRFLEPANLSDSAPFIIDNMPPLYLACPIDDAPDPAVQSLQSQGYATVVSLPLKSAEARDAVRDQLRSLVAGETIVQLFLSRIEELVVVVDGVEHLLDRRTEVLATAGDVTLYRATCGASPFIVARRAIPEADILAVIGRDVANGVLTDRWLEWRGDGIISLAVSAAGERIDGRTYTFLPMVAEVGSPFAGHLDAPFFATLERLRVQEGVELNLYLMAECRALALEAARLVITADAAAARTAAPDFLMWTGPHRLTLLGAALAATEPLFPAVTGSGKGWAQLSEIKTWLGDDVLNASVVARAAGLKLVDPEIGPVRLAALETFVQGKALLRLAAEDRGRAAEAVAQDMAARELTVPRWDRFYRSLAQVFKSDPASLRGREILWIGSDVVPADAPNGTEDEPSRKRRHKRLSAAFLPPLRGGGKDAGLPLQGLPQTVQRRISYLHPELECSRDGASPARRFLVSNNLIREHESREILRMIAQVMAEPGATRDREAVMWACLGAIKRIAMADAATEGVLTELTIYVPARAGWIRATDAFFGRWAGTRGDELDRLFTAAAAASIELDNLAQQVLTPYANWPVGSHDREGWVRFLQLAGVADHLRPMTVMTRQPTKALGWELITRLAARPEPLSAAQRAAWKAQMSAQPGLPNQQTVYTTRDAYRFPGQADHDALTPAAARLYALQIARMIESSPKCLTFTVYRPSPQHVGALNSRTWPSPAGAFVRTAAWTPLANQSLSRLAQAWMLDVDASPPPGLRILEPELRQLIASSLNLRAPLVSAGLKEYGRASSAWDFLRVAPSLLVAATPQQAEQVLSATRDAWGIASLSTALPADLGMVGRRSGRIIARPVAGAGRVLVLDTDDRQMLNAVSESDPDVLLFEPPLVRASAIADFLDLRSAGRFERSSALHAAYEIQGVPFIPDASEPFIEQAASADLRSLIVLTLRYRAASFDGNAADVLDRLARLRLRWIDAISVRLGDVVQPLPGFAHKAVLAQGERFDTVLAPILARDTNRELIVLAEALAEALGDRKAIGGPLLETAALLASRDTSPTLEALAAAFEVPLAEIQSVIRDSRTDIGDIMRLARPFVVLWGSVEAAAALLPGQGPATEDELAAVIENAAPNAPVPAVELLARCRQAGDLETLAAGLDVDLENLNAVLEALGPPYTVIDRSQTHAAVQAAFLVRKEGVVRESLRAAYHARFQAAEDLGSYVAARDATPELGAATLGLLRMNLTNAHLTDALVAWLGKRGATLISAVPVARATLSAAREANLRLGRELVADVRIAALTKLTATHPVALAWRDRPAGEAAVTAAAIAGGWADFDRLDEAALLMWWSRSGFWDAALGATLAEHPVTDAERTAVLDADANAQKQAAKIRRTIAYTGGDFVVGETSFSSVADQITDALSSNVILLATGKAPRLKPAPILVLRPPGSRSGGGSGSNDWRGSDEQRDLTGFCGEVIALEWLKRRFSGRRVVDETAWKSAYRQRVFGGQGDDGLGYDFHLNTGNVDWYFEVKATTGDGLRQPEMVELGSTEINRAEACKGDRKSHYRVLYIANALYPAKARLAVLPNPRTVDGKAFYTELTSGSRLWFNL